MTELKTLVNDIYSLFDGTKKDIDEELYEKLGHSIAQVIKSRLEEDDKDRETGTPRLSSIGSPCARQVWYKLRGVKGEDLTPSTRIKFLFGDILEELLLFLAEAS